MGNESAYKRLIELGMLPLTNLAWKSFNVTLYSHSSYDEYLLVLKEIRNYVEDNLGGVFVIKRLDEVLFIGRSNERIRTRIINQIEKIFIREDERAAFFKLEANQGDLTIYYTYDDREEIKTLLINALNPKYNKWLLNNKIINSPDEAYNNLKDSDFYDELDKDDMLGREYPGVSNEIEITEDSPQTNHKPTGRMLWEKYVSLNSSVYREGILAVNVGADEPLLLENSKALKFASEIAKDKKYHTLYKMDNIRVYGQNHLAERTFYFQK